jgi:hypothetical protein
MYRVKFDEIKQKKNALRVCFYFLINKSNYLFKIKYMIRIKFKRARFFAVLCK